MARKRTKVSRRMLFTWFMLAGFILLFAPQKLTNKFQFAFAHIFRWPLSIGRNISLTAPTQQRLTNAASRRESQLENHIANLREELLQKHQKVEKLSGLRSRFAWEGVKFELADVITASIVGPHNTLIISRGENDGIAKGQFVLGDNSIIGTISDVWSRTAQVKLVTDSTSNIPVKIAKLNIDMLMQGNGDNSARVPLQKIKHKIKIGNIVYARKKPGFLDVPMVVGKVSKCKRDDKNPLVWDITVEPVYNIERLSNVAVIIMNP